MRKNVQIMKRACVVMLALMAVTSCTKDELTGGDDGSDQSSDETTVVNENPVVAMVNFEATYGDKDANIESMIEYIIEAESQGVDILLFPELALTGYSDSSDIVSLAEGIDGESAATIAALADEYDMYISYGAPETSSTSGKAYNSLFVCTPDGDIESYQSIASDMSWSVNGTELKTISTTWGNLGLSVGTEIFEVPEMGRIYVAQGCDIILNATAIADGDYESDISAVVDDELNKDFLAETTSDYFRYNMENNAYLSGVFMVYANLSGESAEDTSKGFIASSITCGPPKESLSDTKFRYIDYFPSEGYEADMVTTELDLSLSVATRFIKNNKLYQPDLYAEWYESIATTVVAEPTESGDPILAIVQMTPAWDAVSDNLATMLAYMDEAALSGVNMIVFPELALTDYASSSDETSYKWLSMISNAQTVDGEYANAILEKAIALNMYAIYGTAELNPEDLTHPYNSAFVADPNKMETTSYQKVHPVEGDWCSWGKTPLIVDTPWGGLGVSICMDSYSYPELARYYALSGCKFLINPTAASGSGKNFNYNITLSALAARDKMVMLSSDLVGACAGQEGDTKTFFGKSVTIGVSGHSAIYYNVMSETDEAMYISQPDMTDTGLDTTNIPVSLLVDAYKAL